MRTPIWIDEAADLDNDAGEVPLWIGAGTETFASSGSPRKGSREDLSDLMIMTTDGWAEGNESEKVIAQHSLPCW